jgi:hypothetical protein
LDSLLSHLQLTFNNGVALTLGVKFSYRDSYIIEHISKRLENFFGLIRDVDTELDSLESRLYQIPNRLNCFERLALRYSTKVT